MENRRNEELKKYLVTPLNVLDEIKEETKKGKLHILYTKYQHNYGGNFSTNINMPYIDDSQNPSYNLPWSASWEPELIIRDLIVVNDYSVIYSVVRIE